MLKIKMSTEEKDENRIWNKTKKWLGLVDDLKLFG